MHIYESVFSEVDLRLCKQINYGKDIFYIDVNEAVCDENGNLYADWTFDQIHLKAKYYQVWENFLMEHGIVKK